jgi:hypothetical protein
MVAPQGSTGRHRCASGQHRAPSLRLRAAPGAIAAPQGSTARHDAHVPNHPTPSDADSSVPLTTGPPETVLAPLDPEVAAALRSALTAAIDDRKAAVAAVAGAHPTVLDAWAALSELSADPVESYAYARVGYHRGLDTLRGSGWRGNGYVRWVHETNRGFLRALDSLRAAAARIGEDAEESRCDQFLHQLDPDWDRRSRTSEQ